MMKVLLLGIFGERNYMIKPGYFKPSYTLVIWNKRRLKISLPCIKNKFNKSIPEITYRKVISR